MGDSHKYPFINKKEFQSLLFYQGASDHIELDSSEKDLEEFYKINNGYETINMLLFPGIENEKARLQIEKRDKISDKILNHMDELLEIYNRLYSAMCKYTYHTQKNDKLLTYRDDRKHTYLCMQDGMNDSFLSTSLVADRKPTENGEEKPFQKKDGLVLMDIEALDILEHIDMNDVLGDQSGYPEENEILYPPFLYLDTAKRSLTEDENKLKDYHGNPPYGKFYVTLKGSTIVPQNLTKEENYDLGKIRGKLIATEEIENIKFVWNEIRNGKESSYPKEVEQYCEWKKQLKLFLRGTYAQIKFDVMGSLDGKRKRMFCRDLTERIREANEKRKKYEKQLQKFNLVEIIVGGMGAFFLSLTMIDISDLCSLNTWCKIIVLLAATVCGITALICGSKSLKDKLTQRTEAFLKYDELLMDWTYETEKTEENLEKYIERMRQIEGKDNQHCIHYTAHMIQDMSKWEESVGKMNDKTK